MKVLLIDDSLSDLRILELLSKKVGLNPVSFTNSRQALETAQQVEGPCLLICDINMPELDGF